MKRTAVLAILALAGWAAAPASAETLYISDVLIVNLREAPRTSAETVELLRTGQPLELLEQEGRYVRVRTRDGKEGWVADQYVTDETPKAMVIRELETRVASLRERAAEAEEEVSSLTAQLESAQSSSQAQVQTLEEELSQARSAATRASQELDEIRAAYQELRVASENVLAVTEERDRLRSERTELASRVEELQSERSGLLRTAAVRWFLAGAGVLLAGYLIGLASRRKRSTKFTV